MVIFFYFFFMTDWRYINISHMHILNGIYTSIKSMLITGWHTVVINIAV